MALPLIQAASLGGGVMAVCFWPLLRLYKTAKELHLNLHASETAQAYRFGRFQSFFC